MTHTTAMPRIVAHRGFHDEAAGGARENTLAAVRAAVEAGITWVEVDVRTTSDGEVVLLHDATLDRLWHDPRAITEVTAEQVRALGSGDRRIPTLTETLDALHGSGATLLIDVDEPTVATAAAHVVTARSSDVAVAWCGADEAMGAVRTALPQAAIWTAWSSTEPPTAHELAGVTLINAQHLLVGKAFVEAVHAHGVEVAVWTVDDGDQAAHLARIGVDSITSNRPVEIRAACTGEVDERARQATIALEIGKHAATATAAARDLGVQTVETKTGPADHVTEVDRGIERWVRDIIGAQFPDHGMVGEEYGGEAPPEGPCWYLDPVDGTANLANGMPWTSFSLALVEDGRPVVGVVLDPIGRGVGETVTPVPVLAVLGQGAWRAGQRLRTRPSTGADPLSGTLVITELDGARAWSGLHQLIDALGARHCTTRIPGSGTASLAGIALGRGVAAIVHRYSPLDHAAAALVVAEAGGTVLDGDGAPNPHPVGGAIIVGADERAAHALWSQWRDVTAAAAL